MNSFRNPLTLERIQIEIDPDTLEYRLEIDGCNLNRLLAVIKDIHQKLESGNLGPNVEVTNENTGKELDDNEREEYFGTIGRRNRD